MLGFNFVDSLDCFTSEKIGFVELVKVEFEDGIWHFAEMGDLFFNVSQHFECFAETNLFDDSADVGKVVFVLPFRFFKLEKVVIDGFIFFFRSNLQIGVCVRMDVSFIYNLTVS